MKRVRSIIAMKGYPFTQKTHFADIIASALRCPLLSYEDILAELAPPLSPEREKEVFRIICRMASCHISSVIFDAVVIDSPLSSAWHLEQLTEIGRKRSLFYKNVRVIIIECKPTNAYSWRLKFMDYMTLARIELIPWYKPKKWEDVEKAIQINPDYDEKSVRGHEIVSKLVLDPLFSDYFVLSIDEAVRYMMTRPNGDGSDVVLFHQWKQLKYSSSSTTDLDCSKDGHSIVSKSTAEGGLSVDCAFCEKQIMMSDDDDTYYYYFCKGCSLALHKHCAESSAPKKTEYMKYACRTCKGKGEDFSDDCGTCIIENHLSTRRFPTVISHVDTEEHLLTNKVLSKKIHERNHCVACGKVSQWTIYLCNICGLSYHYECATLPRRVDHEHGLHHHHLSLRFTSEEAEDYLCNECNQFRDPSVWFYSCEECPYELHLSCVSDSSVPFNLETYNRLLVYLDEDFSDADC